MEQSWRFCFAACRCGRSRRAGGGERSALHGHHRARPPLLRSQNRARGALRRAEMGRWRGPRNRAESGVLERFDPDPRARRGPRIEHLSRRPGPDRVARSSAWTSPSSGPRASIKTPRVSSTATAATWSSGKICGRTRGRHVHSAISSGLVSRPMARSWIRAVSRSRTGPQYQQLPDLAFDGANWFVVWHAVGVYGTRISAGGVVLDAPPILIESQVTGEARRCLRRGRVPGRSTEGVAVAGARRPPRDDFRRRADALRSAFTPVPTPRTRSGLQRYELPRDLPGSGLRSYRRQCGPSAWRRAERSSTRTESSLSSGAFVSLSTPRELRPTAPNWLVGLISAEIRRYVRGSPRTAP